MRHARLYNITCDEIRTALWYEMGRRNMRIPFPIRTLEKRQHNVPESIVSARDSAVEILRGSSALSCLTEAEATHLVKTGKLQLFGPREPIITRGDTGESMFVILEGAVEVIGKTADGPRVVLATLGKGECFGEMSLVTGDPRNATVRAQGDILVLEIRKNDFSPLMTQNPELAERLGELLEKRKIQRTESLDRAAESGSAGAPVDPASSSLANRIRKFFA
jgi:CRP-like cAMP-binding protein